MRLSRALFILPAAVLLIVACVQAGTAQSTTRRVNIAMTCPQSMESENLAVSVTVAPWLRGAEPGDTISWNLVVGGGGTADTSFSVSSSDWVLPDAEYSGDGSIEVAIPSDVEPGEYDYDITMNCNETKVLIDPMMRIEN